jgi:DnaJ-class molecular chaperone
MKDLYKTLGVPESADEATIKKAYRKLAKEYHPDVTGNDKKKTERFKEINEAYGVLGDREKRAEYERLKNAPVRPDGMPEGFDAESFARTFGGGGGMRGGQTFRFGGGSGVEFNEGDLGDLFASLFGERGRGGATAGFGGRPRPARGADVIGTLPVSFAEAALGTRRTVRSGAGGTVDVSVPPGVESGGRLRVAGHGAAAPGKGGSPGDLYLELEVRPDAHLRRNGLDVELDVPVTFSEAALGTKVLVPTVEGPVTVTIPSGTSGGARLRLRGKGIKKPDGTRGDQLVRIEIVTPKIAPEDTESRQLLEELARRTEKKSPRAF